MTGGNQLYKGRIGKPAVCQEKIESDALFDCMFDHLDVLVGLLHPILPEALLNGLTAVVLTETGLTFLGGDPLHLVLPLPLLSMKREIEHQQADPVREKKCKALVAKDAAVLNMRPDTANQFRVLTVSSLSTADSSHKTGYSIGCYHRS